MSVQSWEHGFGDWLRNANGRLKERFALDFVDAGLSEEELRTCAERFHDPVKFADWFGEKYDLLPTEAWDS
jgi:hypothetical protein